MSDQPDKPEDGDAASGEPATPQPLLSADDVHLPEPDVSPEAVEPELSTPADELRLDEPTLGTAEISEESAQATSLDDVAAEARSVAREAEEAGTLATGARPADDPAEAAAPAGTAPAGGTAGDVAESRGEADSTGEVAPVESAREPAADPADLPASLPAEPAAAPATAAAGPETPAATPEAAEEAPGTSAATPEAAEEAPETPAAAPKATETPDAAPETPPAAPDAAPETPWAQPFPVQGPQTPGSPVPPVGGPYGLPPAGTEDAPPTRVRARVAGRSAAGSNRKKLLILGLAGLVLLALLIFAIVSIVNALRGDDTGTGSTPSTTPGADGIIAENISPLELEAGACILGFDAANVSADVTTVTCTTPHNGQLLATTSLPEDADFPGEAALNASGDDLCNSVPIDEDAAAGYSGLTLTQVSPTSGTWAEGDRRIDCFVVSDEGNVITDTLLAE